MRKGKVTRRLLLVVSLGLAAVSAILGNWGTKAATAHTMQKDRPVDLDAVLPTIGEVRPQFPLKISQNQRFMLDSAGMPFLITGDTAWSLMAQLKREDVDAYLLDRKARGFNAILVNLIEHRFASNAPANAYGDAPFLAPGKFDMPNEAYFTYADWIIARASELGLLVFLAPCYSGAGGGSEGWYQEMKAAGADRMHAYGRFVGARYSRFQNVVWVINGDTNPPDLNLVKAVAEGIYETDPDALQTSHNANRTAGADLWKSEPWLKLNNVYTWDAVFPEARDQYLRKPVLPFFLLESQYENGPDISTQRLRAQAYQALLTGASGQIFGNSPIWYFDGTDEYSAPRGWKKALDSPGARSVTQLRDLFSHVQWQDLVPDVDNEFLVGGIGRGQGRSVAARSPDGLTALVYIPEDRSITLKMGPLEGKQVHAIWWDPVKGRGFEASGSPIRAGRLESFRPAAENSGGDGDWILILKGKV
ncbi:MULTISPECIES: DUF4038 domain-containing protein [unclassified Sinorhizobium]|uniref:apiosidase-like domain-containing protein n=1 Tax=unclassified Sinorhizobium TaxID=2613772 RepID=UPI00352398F3